MEHSAVASYGDWKSPISVEDVISKTHSLSAPRCSSTTGRCFFAESTTDGRKTFMEITKHGTQEILPEEFSVANRVYEYGAGLYNVLPDGRIIFSNKDNTVRILDPDTQEVAALVENPVLRYASFNAHPSSPWVLAIEEDHTHDTPPEIQNYVVAINVETAEVKRIVSGADFYYAPQFSYDGSKLAWLQWNHPDLLFDASELYWTTWDGVDSVGSPHLVAGTQHESVAEPHWGPDGSLFFCQETTGYRRIFRLRTEDNEVTQISVPRLEHAEFGEASLFEGSRTYVPLSDRDLIASACINGRSHLVSIDLESKHWEQLATSEEVCHITADAMYRIDDHCALVIATGTASTQTLYRFDIRHPADNVVIRQSTDAKFPTETYSKPERLDFTTRGLPTRGLHGFLWMPQNTQYSAPEGELPPLIIWAHGGPIGYAGCGLNLRSQYFTSRGYAYLTLNYTGSTGHGRAYREALFGKFGAIDTDDVAEAARHLTEKGRVRAGGVGITGISAGGYNTLQSLVLHSEVFAGGFCVSGISDLRRFDDKTHKLEWDYTEALACAPGSSDEDRRRAYRDRSPLLHLDGIRAPLFLLHGTADMVVPLEQAALMAEALRARGGDVRFVQVEGEGHSMLKPRSAKLWLEEEEKWWRRTLL